MADADIEPAAQAAAARMAFQLTYAQSSKPRRFLPGELTGPSIPCAHGNEIGSFGDWDDPRDVGGFPDRTEDEWIDRFANYAINEAVHEALEWLKLDGRPWLNPHGPAEEAIYEAVNALVDRLAEIRRGLGR